MKDKKIANKFIKEKLTFLLAHPPISKAFHDFCPTHMATHHPPHRIILGSTPIRVDLTRK